MGKVSEVTKATRTVSPAAAVFRSATSQESCPRADPAQSRTAQPLETSRQRGEK